jgi:uncharacterized protein YheU (UPF0270 family)
MLIDPKAISEDALTNLAREWVLSNLSESEAEPDIEKWTRNTLLLVSQGELVVEYSEVDESVTLKERTSVCIEEGYDFANENTDVSS